jgi:hypothetical protein
MSPRTAVRLRKFLLTKRLDLSDFLRRPLARKLSGCPILAVWIRLLYWHRARNESGFFP